MPAALWAAFQPHELALEMIHEGPHARLSSTRVMSIFTRDLTHQGEPALAVTSLVPRRWAVLVLGLPTSEDGSQPASFFLTTWDFERWNALTSRERFASVDHELCHCGISADLKPYLRRHDIDEFTEVLIRHGFWRPDLLNLASAIQLKLPLQDPVDAAIEAVLGPELSAALADPVEDDRCLADPDPPEVWHAGLDEPATPEVCSAPTPEPPMRGKRRPRKPRQPTVMMEFTI